MGLFDQAPAQLLYPQAYLAMENGDLQQVTDFRITLSVNARILHLFRQPASGLIFGPQEARGSFNFAIDEEGIERRYVDALLNRKRKQLRAKLPGGQILILRMGFAAVDLDGPLDDATKGSCTWLGRCEGMTGQS